jgi:hypothetical protein
MIKEVLAHVGVDTGLRIAGINYPKAVTIPTQHQLQSHPSPSRSPTSPILLRR